MRAFFVVVLALLALPIVAHADPAPAEIVPYAQVAQQPAGTLTKKPEPKPEPSPWSFSAGASLSLAQGNSDSFDFTADGLAKYERDPWALRLKATFAYGEKDGDVATQAYHVSTKAERKLSSRVYVFGNLDWDRDVPEGLRGLGITFISVGLMSLCFMSFGGIDI